MSELNNVGVITINVTLEMHSEPSQACNPFYPFYPIITLPPENFEKAKGFLLFSGGIK